MSGRYSFTLIKEKVEKRFQVAIPSSWNPRYNIAPVQIAPVITNKNPSEVSFFQWGLIPSWSLNETTGKNLANARSETLLTRAPFKQIIHSHRCLILADGFFEWKSIGRKKQAYRFTLNNDDAFSIAGLWDSWDNGEDIINSFTLITVSANPLVREISDRMPVILPKENEKEWLRDDLSDKEINHLLEPFDSNKMNYYPAHRAINSTQTDTPECIMVAPKIYPGETFSLFDNL